MHPSTAAARIRVLVVSLVPLLTACRGATQVTVDITTDAKCVDLSSPERAALAVGPPGEALEAKIAAEGFGVTAPGCTDGKASATGDQVNSIGSIVVIPSGGTDEGFGITVVAGLGKTDPTKCQANNYKNCIVARRSLRFIPHTPLRLSVFLGVDCASQACSASTTCKHGSCVDAEIDDATLCQEGSGLPGCGEGVLSPGLPEPCAKLALGNDHTCAVKPDGTVWCWGSNASGELGVGGAAGTPPSSPTAVQALGLDKVTNIASGKYHTCAVRSDGTVWCWGENTSGQLGSAPLVTSPAVVPGAEGSSVVAVGRQHSCALKGDGSVWCWGDNGDGQLGAMIPPSSADPLRIPGVSDVSAIAAASNYACALTTSKQLYCWGSNDYGQIGDGNSGAGVINTATLVPIMGASHITLGGSYASLGDSDHTCAITSDTGVSCWGLNNFGELGNGSKTASSVPTAVSGLSGIVEIAAGRYHVCARNAFGKVFCWGGNDSFQLGTEDGPDSATPREVPNLDNVTAIAAGGYHTCALRADKSLVCWGSNMSGQLGGGDVGVNSAKWVVSQDVCK